MPEPQIKILSAADGRNATRSGDLLLTRRPRGVIARFGRGEHSHAGMAAWWGGDLMILEVREFAGGRVVWFDEELRKRGLPIDVYRPDRAAYPRYDLSGSLRVMRRLAGCRYGYWAIARAAMAHAAFVRLFTPADVDDKAPVGPSPFCSGAIAHACRTGGGVDPVPNLADRAVEPADLARSLLFTHRFTVEPD